MGDIYPPLNPFPIHHYPFPPKAFAVNLAPMMIPLSCHSKPQTPEPNVFLGSRVCGLGRAGGRAGGVWVDPPFRCIDTFPTLEPNGPQPRNPKPRSPTSELGSWVCGLGSGVWVDSPFRHIHARIPSPRTQRPQTTKPQTPEPNVFLGSRVCGLGSGAWVDPNIPMHIGGVWGGGV
jgi:hypothetical protein